MTRRDFLKQCAALAGALALPPEVLTLPRELAVFDDYEATAWTPDLYSARSTYCLELVAGDQVGRAEVRRGANVLLRVWAGRHSFGRWTAPLDDAILWSPDCQVVVSKGAVAAVPFADRVLFASDTEQRWLSTVRLP